MSQLGIVDDDESMIEDMGLVSDDKSLTEEEEAARLLLYSKCSCKISLIIHCMTWFVYLLTDNRDVFGVTIRKDATSLGYIGYSNKPIEDLKSQNREPGYKPGDKSTRKSAGYLQFEIMLGPFNHDIPLTIVENWRASSRKLENRLIHGWYMAEKYNAPFCGYRNLELFYALLPETRTSTIMQL